MKFWSSPRIPTPTELACVLFCAFMARPIFSLWFHYPSFKIPGLLIFSIWLTPLILNRTIHWSNSSQNALTSLFTTAGLVVGAAGWLGEMNFLKMFGFALTLYALFPPSYFLLIWIATSICWMPLSQWIFKHFLPFGWPRAQLATAVIALVSYLLIYGWKRSQSIEPTKSSVD